MKNERMEAALVYASVGWRVHPLKPNSKFPMTKWGEAATTDEQTIRNWWTNWPDANVAIATGNDSVVVLDVDIKDDKHGDKSLDALFIEYGCIDTLMVKTCSGGLHLYMTPNAAHSYKNAVDFEDGLDFRADGGYVVAPPSQIAGVRYEWI